MELADYAERVSARHVLDRILELYGVEDADRAKRYIAIDLLVAWNHAIITAPSTP